MSKIEKLIAYIIQQLNEVGENFGWQIGRVGPTYENGYTKCTYDSKAHFRKEKVKKGLEEILDEQSVEIVRCKDCRHYHAETGWCAKHSYFWDINNEPCKPWESSDWKMFYENDFCSWGEKVE